jgi:hypothetical protein
MTMKVIDTAVVAKTTVACEIFAPSIQFPFVSDNPITPDL